MKERIFKSIKLINGAKIDILMPRGRDISRAIQKYQLHTLESDIHDNLTKKPEANDHLDISIFVMAELCVVNGSRRDVDYYCDLMIDDFSELMMAITEALKPIKDLFA